MVTLLYLIIELNEVHAIFSCSWNVLPVDLGSSSCGLNTFAKRI